MVDDFRIKGRSQIYRAGGDGGRGARGAHGWRVSVPGDQVVAAGATETLELSTNVIADTDAYWNAVAPDRIRIPEDLGGVYLLGADGHTPSYLSGLIFAVVVDAGDGEDPVLYDTDGALIHTRTPRSENAMAGFYKLLGGALIHFTVQNTTGGSVTIEKGSITGFLILPDAIQTLGEATLEWQETRATEIYVNGELIYESIAGADPTTGIRQTTIPEGILRTGPNVVAARISNNPHPFPGAGWNDNPTGFHFRIVGGGLEEPRCGYADRTKSLELYWAGGTTNSEPSAWGALAFDDSGWPQANAVTWSGWPTVWGGCGEWLKSGAANDFHLDNLTYLLRTRITI